MSNQVYHKRAVSGVQQSNSIKLKETNLITTMTTKKNPSDFKTQSPLLTSNNNKNTSNSKVKTQNKSSQKSNNNVLRSVSPLRYHKDYLVLPKKTLSIIISTKSSNLTKQRRLKTRAKKSFQALIFQWPGLLVIGLLELLLIKITQ